MVVCRSSSRTFRTFTPRIRGQLNVSYRNGLMPHRFQRLATVSLEIPNRLPRIRLDQRVMPSSGAGACSSPPPRAASSPSNSDSLVNHQVRSVAPIRRRVAPAPSSPADAMSKHPSSPDP